MSPAKSTPLALLALCLAGSCNRPDLMTVYRNAMETYSSPDWLARAGSIQVTKRNFFYATGSEVIDLPELELLPGEARQIVLKKVIARRLAIASGAKTGIYESEEAAKYILPRLEAILEDYYYLQQSTQRGTGNGSAILPGKEELSAWAAGRGISDEQARLRAGRILSSYNKLKSQQLREQILSELLLENPIEVRK
ncbi:MAG: hypothetical protein HS115_07020 [Spirochaetales bacterium]|nr:hypothetical protein [Spirochaetales bacterium]